MAKTAVGAGGADSSVADELRGLGVKGVLVQMAERGQLLDLKCEMPQCYHHKGRAAFDPVAKTRSKWAPSPDHYPILKSAGGQLRPRERSAVPHGVQPAGLHPAEADRDAARERQVPRRDRRDTEPRECPPGPRYEPMDGRDGAQSLRVLGGRRNPEVAGPNPVPARRKEPAKRTFLCLGLLPPNSVASRGRSAAGPTARSSRCVYEGRRALRRRSRVEAPSPTGAAGRQLPRRWR